MLKKLFLILALVLVVGFDPTVDNWYDVEDWEIEESLKVAPPLIKAYVELKLLTGLRMSDMLSIRLSDIKEDGLHVTPRKTANSSGKKLIIRWDEGEVLREAINNVRKLKRPTGSIWLFCTRYGQPYIKEDGTMNAFESILTTTLWEGVRSNAKKVYVNTDWDD